MAVTFFGNGSVYFPKGHRFLRFVGGEFITNKVDEVLHLKESGYKFEGFLEDAKDPDAKPINRGRSK